MIWLLLAFMVVVVFLVGGMLAQIDYKAPTPKPVSKRRLSQMTILEPDEDGAVIIQNIKPKRKEY